MIASGPVRGFTLFEFAVVMIIVGLLSFLLLSRLHAYQHDAEHVAVQQVVGTMRTALSIKIAQLSVAKKEQELRAVIDENPINWLVQPPENYLGEYYSSEGNALPGGTWHFDKIDKQLVYKLRESHFFQPRKQMLLKFKVKFLNLPLQQDKIPALPSTHNAAVLDQVSDKTVVNN